ncbi:hypothetical protein F4813DRAFT_157841 [Daldinia decipiens]|uniref:uncharacterized protein n=1 Tax=Daldinia decipiens TaxID=326647 RepID=UPI0020C4836D|nr:uncharacterized protein F4813DRAFT_157841 [Daldinia decipiens]KAI1655658.1 hypothetical protein F4813DRAFT_157841 [Daldinia decipiens]
MTTPVSGSSLPQTRDVHQHDHFHNSRDSHYHHHHYHHRTHHTHDARSQNSNKRGHKRTDSEPTIIVTTVSVLELIDSSGVPITTQTLTPSSNSTPPTSSSYITTSSEPDVNVDPTSTTTSSTSSSTSSSALGLPTSSPGTSDDEGDGLSSTSIPTIDPTVAPSESSMPTIFPTLSYSPLTSTPLSGSPVFPSLAGVTNTTQSSSSTLSLNSTSSTPLPSFSIEGFNSSLSESSSTILSSDSSSSSSTTTTSSSSSSSTTTTRSNPTSSTFGSWGVPTQTGDSTAGVGNAQPSSSNAVATDGDSVSNGPEAATVAGSVLGGVAALAGILILALFLLRWKKRQNTLKLIRGSTSERGPGGGLVGNSGPGGGGEGGMSETRRRSVPFAIPAALASLTGYKHFSGRSAASSDGGERGFSKVSGRKLPPVIQFGGDGYSDPRDTILSEQSIDYRDSAFPGLGGGLAPTRLAVGAPMRPESGIPVFNPGPARTPKTEQVPFSPGSELAPPRDPLGRSHPSHDGSSRSHGSASRFTEEL